MAAKRKSMDDVYARIGQMNATRPEPETVAEPVQAIEPETAQEPKPPTVAIVSAPVEETTRPALKDGTPTAYKRETVSTRARSHVEKERMAKETRPAKVPKGYNVRPPRIEKPHQSIYADPAVFRVIRQIAATEDVKPQDLYREALRLMLKRRGYDFDKLDSGEG
jgi:hypothetical protein